MAIAFVSAGAQATGANPTVALPVGYNVGDLLIILSAAGTAFTQAAPAGWTIAVINQANERLSVYYKFATNSETSVLLDNGGSTGGSAIMLAYSGVKAIDVIGANNSGSSTSAPTIPLITTQVNDYVVSFYTQANSTSNTWNAPSGTTIRASLPTNGTYFGLLVVDEIQVAAGATTARTATLGTSILWDAIAISFSPLSTNLITRLTSTGTYLSGPLDETTYLLISVTTNTVYSATFDEVNIGSGSLYFNGGGTGSPQYLSVPSTGLGLSGNLFTIEGWFYPTDYGKTGYSSAGASFIISTTNTSAGSGGNFGFQLAFDGVAGTSLTRILLYLNNGTINSTFNYAFSLNKWYHVACVRNTGGVFTIYVNGTSIGTVTNATTWTDNSPYTIGRSNQGGYERPFTGYISNFRIIIGTALYTSTFTPSTTPLSITTNTQLLLTMQPGNAIADTSYNSFTVSNIGTPTFNSTSPFNIPTGSTSTTVVVAKRETSTGNLQVAGSFDETAIAIYGNASYIYPGTYSWTAPLNVTSISVVTVGGGGGGGGSNATGVGVATSGTTSYFNSTTTVAAGGGGVVPGNNNTVGAAGGAGGVVIAGTGTNGSTGSLRVTTFNGVGGGGAGLLTGGVGTNGAEGAWGGGGGQGASITSFGAGLSGGPANANNFLKGGLGGQYGGGAGGGRDGLGGGGGAIAYINNYAVTPGQTYTVVVGAGGIGQNADGPSNSRGGGVGSTGVVQIIWPGDTRQFPSTNIA